MKNRVCQLAAISAIVVVLLGQVEAQYPLSFEIPLKSGSVVLQRGSIDPAGSRYVIVQFDRVLSKEERAELHGQGINLLSFLYNKAWLCAAEPSAFTGAVITSYGIAAVSLWKPEYKMSPNLKEGKFEQWAVTDKGEIKLLVIFHADAERRDMEGVLGRYASIFELYREPDTWAIQIAAGLIYDLSKEALVKAIEQGLAPQKPTMDQARAVIHADAVQDIDLSVTPPVYRGLSGKGVNAATGEYVCTDHPDFMNHDHQGNPTTSRFLNPVSGSCSDPDVFSHGTHVAGIIGGNGWNSDKGGNNGRPFQWRGIAPEATLIGLPFDFTKYRFDVFNYSFCSGASYHASISATDRTIRGGDGPNLRKTQNWSAGNDGLTPYCAFGAGYYFVATYKNAIVVGAAYANDGSLASCSSLGPTLDGRIKPDVIAPGDKNTLPRNFDPAEQMTMYIDYIYILAVALKSPCE